jgi:hypothetical protein
MNLTFGIKDGKHVHVSQVESGTSCGCICPKCNKPLIAKKGPVIRHHFAHHHDSIGQCTLESVLHVLAKDIIKDAGKIYIPDVEINLYRRGVIKRPCGKIVRLDKVKEEENLGRITPDIVGYHKESRLLIEIYVTHKSDQAKIDELKSRGLSAIEIDLSGLDYDTHEEEFENLVLYDKNNRYWLNNRLANDFISKLWNKTERIEFDRYGSVLNNATCPIIKGAPMSIVCTGCEYAFHIEEDEQIVECAAKHKDSIEKLLKEFESIHDH